VNLVGNPADILRTAAQIDQKADQLDALGRRIESRANGCSWTCARADRFRSSMSLGSTRTAALAQELHEIANQLKRTAASVQSELDLLHRLESRARAIIHADAAAATRLATRGWSVTHLPAPGDPAWHSVARSLGA
jgi:uncharacterized protein YukE